jgi:hypothetical protein
MGQREGAPRSSGRSSRAVATWSASAPASPARIPLTERTRGKRTANAASWPSGHSERADTRQVDARANGLFPLDAGVRLRHRRRCKLELDAPEIVDGIEAGTAVHAIPGIQLAAKTSVSSPAIRPIAVLTAPGSVDSRASASCTSSTTPAHPATKHAPIVWLPTPPCAYRKRALGEQPLNQHEGRLFADTAARFVALRDQGVDAPFLARRAPAQLLCTRAGACRRTTEGGR